MDNLNPMVNKTDSGHIPFDEMAEYIFSDGRSPSFMKAMARINHHVACCPECYKVYQDTLFLREKLSAIAEFETGREKYLTKMISFLIAKDMTIPPEKLIEECLHFKMWISFSIKNMKELIKPNDGDFSYPRLKAVLNSASGRDATKETEAEIRSSLLDKNRNRVSIGLDGTLSLYFDETSHPVGKRVIILPDDSNSNPQMFELSRYDESISYIRFEGIRPGQYTVMLEE